MAALRRSDRRYRSPSLRDGSDHGGQTVGRPHVVIVGAGFGGLAAAAALAAAPVRVTVIDRHNYHLFQPLLYQVATASLSPAEISMPIRTLLRDQAETTVLLDEVVGIDMAARAVLTRDGGRHGFDYLVLATGADYSYFGHDDWRRLAPGIKTLQDATAIRDRILLAFERAETARSESERRRLMSFVLVGGGPTGVELAGAIAELARTALPREFRKIDPRAARIVLLEAMPRLLSGFPASLGNYARHALERIGVEVRLGAPVTAMRDGQVTAQGTVIEAATILWCAGVEATPIGRWLGVETARNGTVRVAADLSLPGHPEIFVIGDAASARGRDGRPLPGVAPVAKQEGAYVAKAIAARVAGRPAPGPFVYRDMGSLATIGRSAAVAEFGRVRLRGAVAWAIWSVAHIYYLIGFRNRVLVFLNWAWTWLTNGRGVRLITSDRPAGADGAAEPMSQGAGSETTRSAAGQKSEV